MRIMFEKISITVESKYYRNEFDDWLAGGIINYKGKRYYWSAQDSNYGFGWDIETVDDEEGETISEEEFNAIVKLIEKSLYEHKIEYEF